MDTFRVLLVDDDKEFCKARAASLAKALQSAREWLDSSRVVLRVAHSEKEARRLIEAEFFHVAFVDICLDDKTLRNRDGISVLVFLQDVRPSCERDVVTNHPDVYRENMHDLLYPRNRLIDGCLAKFRGGQTSPVDEVVLGRARAWLFDPVEIEGVNEVFDLLKERARRNGPKVAPTRDELSYVLSRLFGQGESHSFLTRDVPERPADEITAVRLSELPGGRSRSIVRQAEPRAGTRRGNVCVVKVGPREEAEQEIHRYRRFARYLWRYDARVELLNATAGDTLAAIAYSFGGGAPGRVTTLTELLQSEDELAFEVLSEMFDPSPETRDWYAAVEQSSDMVNYFATEYPALFSQPDIVLKQVRDFVQTQRDRKIYGDTASLRRREGGSEFVCTSSGGQNTRIAIKHRVLTINGPALYWSCLVHGDLNSSNILVGLPERTQGDDSESEDSRKKVETILIDYRRTGRGPVALDFAALEASSRIASVQSDDRQPVDVCFEDKRREANVWSSVWHNKQLLRDSPYWARLSSTVGGLARSNFVDDDGNLLLSEREYAATCLYRALRLFPIPGIGDPARRRLFIWIGHLSAVLERAT